MDAKMPQPQTVQVKRHVLQHGAKWLLYYTNQQGDIVCHAEIFSPTPAGFMVLASDLPGLVTSINSGLVIAPAGSVPPKGQPK